jgi:hypothetical protein
LSKRYQHRELKVFALSPDMTIRIDARSPVHRSGAKLELGMALALVISLALTSAQAQQAPSGPFRAPTPGRGEASSSPPPPGTIREGMMPPGAARLYIVEQPGNTLLATDYIGRAVYGPGNEKVAVITNLLVDTTGRIVAIVMDVGGFLGFGSKEIAIAFEALYPVMEDGKEAFIVEMSKAQLAAAPAFKRSQ